MAFTTLVDGATLARHVGDPAWVLVDCRHDLANPAAGEAAYGRGHIPGALFLHLDRDLSGPKSGRNGRHPLPDMAALAATLGRIGIGAGTQVVAYDDCGGMMAGRLWWLLRWLGHDSVALLDGGLPAWSAAGGALSDAVPTPLPAVFTPHPRPWVLSADEVLAGLGQPERLILDARAPDRFRGENETLDPAGGHIPGARNRFFRDNLGADGRFKPAGQLRQEFAAVLDGHGPTQVVHQCGSGVSACHNLLAMEIAGLPGSRLYAGSWSEWCADPARPVAR
ncbi:MAG TPA: sulfurtransferase [Azospira sp.]|nr:sulfurtransferase [Azospira sp.]